MKKALLLIILTGIISCTDYNEDLSYADHISQIDSIVSANNDMKELELLLSLDYHERSLSLAKELKDTLNIIYILNQLGTDFRRLGVLDEAAVRHYEAISYCEKYSDHTSFQARKNKVVSLNGIGNIQLTLQNNDAAEKVFREALAGEKSLESHLGQAINYANIGYLKEAGGDKDSAWIYYEYSMEQNRLANSTLGISLCYNHFGRLSEQSGDYGKALESFKNSYDLMLGNKDKWHWLESGFSIARVYLAMGQPENARRYISEGLQTAEEIHSWEHLAEAYRLRAVFEEKTGDYKTSLENYKRYLAYTDSVDNEKNINHLSNLRVNYITEKGNKEKESHQSGIRQRTAEKEDYPLSALRRHTCFCCGHFFAHLCLESQSQHAEHHQKSQPGKAGVLHQCHARVPHPSHGHSWLCGGTEIKTHDKGIRNGS